MSEINAKKLLEEALGFQDLGLYAEAEDALREVMAKAPDARDFAQGRLISLLSGECRYAEAADLGADLIARRNFDYPVIITTMLALNYLGRVKEARDTLRLVEDCGHPLEEDAYQMACFAARLGEFPEALRWLGSEFRRSSQYYVRSFVDTDLAPFWKWLSTCTPTLEEAHRLIEMPLKEVCAAAFAKDAPIELTTDDLAAVGEPARQLFRYNHDAGFFTLDPCAAAAATEAVAEVLRKLREARETVRDAIRKGHERATGVVLDAQLGYAAEHAAWGNHLGARYHILWAVNLRPVLVLDFYNDSRLGMMRPLLKEMMDANRDDGEFLTRMHEARQCAASDSDRAWKLLEKTPEKLRSTALYQLCLANVFQAEGDYARAMPLWAELRRRWPDDAVGWGNAVACLRGLERNDEARDLLAAAPACYRRFRLYWSQMAGDIARGETIAHFSGRPDLGGLLLPPNAPNPETDPL